ncbi:MAG TPA: hypothetical protein VM692_01170 [Gammaproteobacteria bacterium]|nr:hypothetical protein [Gammaproteobacteria bacterium]
MRCEDAIEQITARNARPGRDLRAATEHAESCADCRAALRALDALRPLRTELAPLPSDGAMERAIDLALAANPAQRYRRGFLSGMAAGAALAATLAAVAVGLWLSAGDQDAPRAVPEVRIALNQPRDVTVTVESPEALADAEVRVELRGAVALEGYAGQRELRWMTDLDRGVNQLTLPVVALDASGGQVLVEVTHGDKRRAFVLDVRGGAAG